ncbi:MAG: VCBS repeat-containing protein [Planctomycetes bacterium]|nr:VCBS repeat-containing protein [Planctomycetota bacterium]
MSRSTPLSFVLAVTAASVTWTVPSRCWSQEEGRAPSRQQEIEELMGKNSPLDDDWETEIQYKHADHELKELARVLERRDAAALAAAARFFAPDSLLPPLRRPGEERFAAGRFSVTRWSAPPAAREEPALDPAQAFADLLAPFPPGAPLAIAFKIYRVERAGEGRFRTLVLYQAFGAAPGRSLQQNGRWWVAWAETDDPDHPLIAGIALVDFDEIVSRGPQFTECTSAVFADDGLFADLMLRGGEYWFGRSDALGEWNYLGHNGLAVGDVNGDGLDDLYVATGTGIPNRLYVQNPDATASERALEAGVAWLDDTKGVLLFDYDNDGDQDLACAMGPLLVVSANDGTGTFAPAHALRAATSPSFYSLAAADYDLDGDLDIYACRYVKTRYGESLPDPFHDAQNGPPKPRFKAGEEAARREIQQHALGNTLLRNDGDGTFADVSDAAGIRMGRWAFGAIFADFENDGFPDMVVPNGFLTNELKDDL